MRPGPVRLVGLGCGGGQKDASILCALAGQGRALSYSPCDISLSLVLTASLAAQTAVAGVPCHPLVCDLAGAADLPTVFARQDAAAKACLFTFFGMIPNFEPEVIMPRLAALLRQDDLLLFSANLAPGPDYAAGVRQVFPGYDNQLTRVWLMTFLLDLGVEQGDGKIEFSIEDSKAGLKRIVADFRFDQPRELEVCGEDFNFAPGDSIRLFFSYRHTPALVRTILARHGVSIMDHWVTRSGEEGVFLCHSSPLKNYGHCC